MPLRVPSERGRTEYVMVSLVGRPGEGGDLAAYPTAKGSGAVTAFAQADGFFAIAAALGGRPGGTRGHGPPPRRRRERRRISW